MKQRGTAKASAARTSILKDTNAKKSLHVLQQAATNKENLVGAGRTLRSIVPVKETLKDEMSEKTKSKTVKRKKVTRKDKAVQTTRDEKIKIEAKDLTSEVGLSENYWELLADQRRIALDCALVENKKLAEQVATLFDQNATLEQENRMYLQLLDEAKAIVEVLQEMTRVDSNDEN